MKKITLQCLAIGLLAQGSFAQDNLQKDSTLQNTYELEGVTIITTKTGDNTPFAFNNLKKKDLEKVNDGKNLPYVLDFLPSVLVNSDDGIGVGYADMRIRGTDNQRINITINGIPMNDAESQTSFLVNIPDMVSSASDIQVQRGAGASTNGAGAFGASVHVNNLEQSNIPFFEMSNSFGSFNSWRHTLKAGSGKLNNGFKLDMRLSKISSDGYIDRGFSDLKSLQTIASWTSSDLRSNIIFNLFTGKERTGQAWTGVLEDSFKTNPTYNELGMKVDGSFYNDQTDNYQQDYYQLFFKHQFNTFWNANLALFLTRGRGYYNEYKTGESYSTYGLPDFSIDSTVIDETALIRQLWLDNYFYGIVSNVRYKKGSTQVDLGVSTSFYDGLHYGKIKWAEQGIPADYEWYRNKADKNDQNIFVKWEENWLPGLYSYADLQLRTVKYIIDGFRKNPSLYSDNQYLFFNPKFGLSYFWGNQKTYFSIAKAAKEPNREDFESGGALIPKAEQLWDFELGYQFQKQNYGFNANLYWMQYKNQLINTGKINDVGAYTRQNVDNSFRRGVELSAWVKGPQALKIQANATISQNKIKNLEEYIDDYDNGGQVLNKYQQTDIALSPAFIGIIIFSYPVLKLEQQQLELSLIGKYISRQYLDNTSNKDRSLSPYGLVHFRASYQFQSFIGKYGALHLQVNNILNQKYASKGYTYSYFYEGLQTFNYYYPQAGTNFSLSFTLGF